MSEQGKVSVDVLEARLAELEAKQAQMDNDLEKTRQLMIQLKRKQIMDGPLAPLVEALTYHHEMVCGWARLAAMGEPCNELAVEFAKMYKVVTHYEYVTQQLLGINPSPLADLEQETGK